MDYEELARLLTEARKGDEPALATLLGRLRGWVRRRAQTLLGPGLCARLDGSDIAQEVFLRAWRGFSAFRGDSLEMFLAWLEKILQDFITDCLRRHGAAKRDADAEVAGGDLFPGLPADATTPSQGAMRNEEQAHLKEALPRLPEPQQRVVRLRIYEGLPFEEVAREVGTTPGNARVLMVRAIERLKNDLGV